MAKSKANLCPETLNFSSNADSLNLNAKQEESIENSIRNAALDSNLVYVIVPQKNTAVDYVIGRNTDNTPRQVTSHRFFCAGFDSLGNLVEVRTVGVQTLRAMAYCFVEDGVAAPIIKVEDNGKGNFKAVQGTTYVRAMDDTRFIKVVDHRAAVDRPTAFRALGTRDAYASKFGDDRIMMRDEQGNAVLEVTHMKMFVKDSLPAAELVKAALEACKEVGGNNFYEL